MKRILKYIDHPLLRRIIVILLFDLLVIWTGIVIVIMPFINISLAKDLSEIYNKVGVGFGAFLASFGAAKIIAQYFQSNTEKSLEVMYKNFYSMEKYKHGDFKVVVSKDNKWKVYVHEIKNNIKRWISNYITYQRSDLLNYSREIYPKKKFDAIPEEEPIYISGIKGT